MAPGAPMRVWQAGRSARESRPGSDNGDSVTLQTLLMLTKATSDGRKIGQDCKSCHRIRE